MDLPAMYTPGETYPFTINPAHPDQSRWGFELTVLEDAVNGAVGTLNVTDATNTQKSVVGSGREYLKHTSAGTFDGTALASPGWTMSWTAPPIDVGPVTFYVAGNAANSNSSPSGDFIYTTQASVTVLPENWDVTDDTNCDMADVNLMFTQGDLVAGVTVGEGNQFDLISDLTLDNLDVTEWLSRVQSGYQEFVSHALSARRHRIGPGCRYYRL